MPEYVEREKVLEKGSQIKGFFCNMISAWDVAHLPAADVMRVPQEYAYYTSMDDENYLVNITFPITKEQFEAIGAGKDLWAVMNKS